MRPAHGLVAVAVSQNILHHRPANLERGVAQGPTQNGAQVIFVLRARAAFDGVVTAVVRSRRALVEQNRAILEEEELDAKDPRTRERPDRSLRRRLHRFGNFIRNRRRRRRRVANIVFVNGFDDGVRPRLPILGAHHHHRQFLLKRHPLLAIQPLFKPTQLRHRIGQIRGGLRHRVPASVVRQTLGL